MKVSKLSKQQKAILEEIWKKYQRGMDTPRIRYISQDIAEKFNKEHDDRLFDREVIKQRNIEDAKQGDELAKLGLSVMEMYEGDSRFKKELLTGKHSASFSRSLKRLVDRGLIVYEYNYGYNRGWNHLFKNGVRLTKEGRELCQQLFEDESKINISK